MSDNCIPSFTYPGKKYKKIAYYWLFYEYFELSVFLKNYMSKRGQTHYDLTDKSIKSACKVETYIVTACPIGLDAIIVIMSAFKIVLFFFVLGS